jgi:hypothetical protein
MSNRQLVAIVNGEIGRATNRRYRINLDALDDESLRELQRLLRDLDYEKRTAASRAQTMPWRRV